MPGRGLAYTCAAALVALFSLLAPRAAWAQLGELTHLGGGPTNGPVTFSADSVAYEQGNSLVVAKGHVEAWQNDYVLRADEVTFNRKTGVATAKGHIVLLEPNGEVLFADSAELSDGMRNGVLHDLRARLPQNARLAANGARRTEGVLNELSKVVYSTCNLCKKNPYLPPLWQIRARTASQDTQHKRIEYTDAELQIFGVPVAWFPYFWHADPSVKRASGLLVPSVGANSRIGGFFAQPYYWVINNQSDAVITPMITTQAGPNLDVKYRYRFNSGLLNVDTSVGYLNDSVQGALHTSGQFSLNRTWRYGFDIYRASSADFVRDFHIGTVNAPDLTVLPSQVYAEGFGEGAYARFDARFYQGLDPTVVADSKLPVVLPRFEYRYFGRPDALGGRLSVAAGLFNVLRTDGTNTRRARLSLEWDRPFVGRLGDLWTLKLHADALAYNVSQFDQQPNFAPTGSTNAARALPQVAVDFRWPFMRDSGSWGTQLIEPMAEIILAPQSGDSQLYKYPNEDSLDFEFTDANLFGFNNFPGVDRLVGGVRANVALKAGWYLGGTAFDGLIGQSYRTNTDNLFPVGSGLHDKVSDIVARASFSPASWLDLTYRTRLDHQNLDMRMADVTAGVGGPRLHVTGGYLYTTFDPYYYYDQPAPPPPGSGYYFPRNEITLGASTSWGDYRLSAFARRDLATNQMVAVGADGAYENECFIMDLKFYRRYTQLNGDNGATTVLLQLTFKTIGSFGFRAL